MDNDSSVREAAVAAMTEMFLACAWGASDFADFEDGAIAEGRSMMAEAMGRALEARDAELAAGRPAELRMRDLRGGARWPRRWAPASPRARSRSS